MSSESAASLGISLKGERELKRLANETGGRVFFPPRLEELSERLRPTRRRRAEPLPRDVYADEHRTRRRLAGVNLTTPAAKYLVRTRAGYRAPKPPPIRPTLEFTVTDLSGQYVEISADDLVVSEDGVDQKVDTFHEAATPVSIVLALDSSGSMRKKRRRPGDGGPHVRRIAAPGRQAIAAVLLGRRGRGARSRHQPPDEHRRDHRIQAGRRHGALRRGWQERSRR